MTKTLKHESLKHVTLFALLLSLLTFAAVAQEVPPPADSSEPSLTLRTSTHMVVLDVVVTNSSDKHAKDLRPEDFTVTEDGVPQKVVSFDVSNTRATSPKHALKGANTGITSVEAPSGAPETILVLDELDTEWVINAQARLYLKKYFITHGPRLDQPTALLALTNEGLEMISNFTRDAQVLNVALARHRTALPYHVLNAEGVTGAFKRLGIALTAMYQIAQASADHQSRKNLVWIGEGFPGINIAVSGFVGGPATGTRTAAGLDSSTQQKARQMVQRLANALLEARISVYTVDPVGLIYSGSILDPRILTTNGELIFENIAPETGGKIYRNLNDVSFLVDKSVHDGASYYTLAYYPSNKNWNGDFRKIKVTVDRPGLEARTRMGYYAFDESDESSDKQIDLALSVALRNPVPYTLIPVTISAKPLEYPAHTFELTIQLDRSGLSWTKLPNGDERAQVIVVTASLSADNRVLKYKVREFESVVEKKRVEALRTLPLVFKVEAEVPPKTARVRCIVRDATSDQMGSAELASTDPSSQLAGAALN